MIAVSHYSQVPASLWPWLHFTPRELADHKSGALKIDPLFMDRLEKLRVAIGRPLTVNSGYRTPEHNLEVAETGPDGPHTTGHAVDLACAGIVALDVIRLAIIYGFTGIGVQQKGGIAGRYVHLDDLTAPAFPRPTIWTY